ALSLSIAQAQTTTTSIPDVTGNYSGTYTFTAANCTDSNNEGTHTGTAVINVNSQEESAISGTYRDRDLSTDTGTFSGTVNSSGVFSVTTTDQDGHTGTETGTFSGDRLTVNAGGYTSNSTGCEISYDSQSLTRNSVLPAESASSNVVNTPEKLKTAVVTYSSQVTKRIGNVMRNVVKVNPITAFNDSLRLNFGQAAGDDLGPIGVWGSYSYSRLDHDHAAARFDGEQHAGLVGVDFFPSESVLLGVSVGYDMGDIDTQFNGGNVENDGFTIAPYLGLTLGDTTYADLTLGMSFVEYDQRRTSAAGTQVTSSVDSDRLFLTANLNHAYPISDKLAITARAGVLYAEEDTDAFTESDGTVNPSRKVDLTQIQLGGEVSYLFNPSTEGFVNLAYNNDVSSTSTSITTTTSQPFQDDDEFVLGLGARTQIDDSISAGVEFTQIIDRKNYDEYSITLDVRAVF
ncbi:MAG: autotransporter outer membrane beta-barrel domain-containing protein, partial [Gammaproteobacteria bacterium]